MVARYHGWNLPQEAFVEAIERTGRGVNEDGCWMDDLARSLREYGFAARTRRFGTQNEVRETLARGIPIIALADQVRYQEQHFYLLLGADRETVFVRDPWDTRRRQFPLKTFMTSWEISQDTYGIAVGAPQLR